MDDEKKEETKENKKIKLDNTPYKIIEAIINKLTKKKAVYDEETENKLAIDESVVYENIKKHNKNYDKLLENYAKTNTIKIRLKIIFFVASMVIWFKFIYLFIKSNNIVLSTIQNIDGENINIQSEIISLVISLIPSLVSVLASFIVIPKTIAKYLFNPKEDIDSIKMIKNLQIYDMKLYQKYVSLEEEAVSNEDPPKDPPNDQGGKSEDLGKTGT